MKKKVGNICILLVVVCVLGISVFAVPMIWCSQGLAFEYLPLLSGDTMLDYIKEEKMTKRYDVDDKEEKLLNVCFCTDLHSREEMTLFLYNAWNVTTEYVEKKEEKCEKPYDITVVVKNWEEIVGIRNFTEKGVMLENKWILYNGVFENWDSTENFCDVYGLDNCYIVDVADVDVINADKWKNISFMHIVTWAESSEKDQIQKKLKEILPGVEITIE